MNEEKQDTLFEETKQEILSDTEDQPKQKKRKRGRPRKKPEPEPEIVEVSPDHIKPILSLVSGYLGKRLGKGWELTEDEMEFGSRAFSQLATKYSPILAKYDAEINCFVFVSAYLLARFDLLKQKHKKKTEKENAQSNNQRIREKGER